MIGTSREKGFSITDMNFGLLHYPPVRGNFVPKFKDSNTDHEVKRDMRMNLLLRVFKLLSGIGSPLDIPANPHCQDVALLRMVNLSIHDLN